VLRRLLAWVVPDKVVVTTGEIDVFFVEDGSPLERSSMQYLTRRAMAELGVKRLLSAQLILYLPTMTAGLVSNFEVRVVLVHLVRSSVLPVIVLVLRGCDVLALIVLLVGSHVGSGLGGGEW